MAAPVPRKPVPFVRCYRWAWYLALAWSVLAVLVASHASPLGIKWWVEMSVAVGSSFLLAVPVALPIWLVTRLVRLLRP